MTVTRNFLRRYGDLPSLIHLLTKQSITFLDPATWDDKNDSLFMRLYKKNRSLSTLLALCFTQETETYHHWSVFAEGPSGVCISFKKWELLDELTQYEGVRSKKVSYVLLNDLDTKTCKPKDLPFMKRAPFKPEAEFRVIYEEKGLERSWLNIEIPLSCIDRVYLSPWMPKTVASSVQKALKLIPGAASIEVSRSTLIQNDTWAKFGHRVAGEPITTSTKTILKKKL